MTVVSVLLLFFFLLPAGAGAGAVAQDHDHHSDECTPTRCGPFGPEIRFPFWLKNRHPDHCGYGPAFALTCSPTNTTLLDNPFSVKVELIRIDYFDQQIIYESSGNYDPRMQNLSFIFNTSPFSPIQICTYGYPRGPTPTLYSHGEIFDIFSCPSSLPDPYLLSSTDSPWLNPTGRDQFYLLKSDNLISRTLLNCTSIYTFTSSQISNYIQVFAECPPFEGFAAWCEPNCRKCEENEEYCRLSRSNSSKKNETECFSNSYYMPPRGEKDSSHDSGEVKRELAKGLIPSGIFLLLVLVMVTFFAHRSNNLKKEDQLKVERFLEDYRALKPTRYTYTEIKKVTRNLKDKLGHGGYGTVYKGELSNDVPIAAKILDNFKGNGEDFINEIGTIGMIHHVNVVRLVGYCADGYKKALLYEYMPNGSLDKFISSDHRKISLGWEKLQDIALGIAKGIEYLHQGCDQRILHFDIKPHNILLDKNFIPKISDFGLAKLCSKEQSVVSMTAARGTVGYIAPEVFSRNFGNVSHKSDVYSFGMLLLEMVGGRKKNIDVGEEENSDEEVYFPEWIYNRLNREKVNNSEVEEGLDAEIVKKLTVVGLWCIQWYPGDRPSMKVVVKMLEGYGENLDMPPNPFSTTSRSIRRRKMGERPFSSVLEIISESD